MKTNSDVGHAGYLTTTGSPFIPQHSAQTHVTSIDLATQTASSSCNRPYSQVLENI